MRSDRLMSHRRLLSDHEMGRANNFDALRVALALLVIFSHSYSLLLGNGIVSEPLYRLTGGQRSTGEIAVDGFFLISGYLITASWKRCRGLGDYLRRRVLRIYPGFLVAVAFSSLVAGPLLAPDSSEFWGHFRAWEFLKNAFGLVGAWTPSGSVNGSLWSIRYEFHCYLALAVFGMMGLLRWRGPVVLFALFCSGLYAAERLFGMVMPGSGLSWLWGFPGAWPRMAGCFFVGSAFHLLADKIVHSGRLALASFAGLLLAAFIPGSKVLPLLFPYLGGYLILYLAYVPAGCLKDIARHGDLSYGLYLYAAPIQLLLIHRFKPSLSTGGLTILATIVTAVFAAFSWHFVERPFLVLKKTSPPTGPVPQESVVPAETASSIATVADQVR